MKISRKSLKKTLECIGWELAGAFLSSVAISNFAARSDFPMTGFSGIALIFYRLFGLPIGVVTILLNIPAAVFGYKVLGRSFMLRSLRCMLFQSLMVDYLCPLLPAYQGPMILSAVCCGILSGVGYGLVYRCGSSTGGMDFITLSLKNLKRYWNIGLMNFIADSTIVCATAVIFQDFTGLIYGVMIAYLSSRSIDKIMFGANAGKLLLIVSDFRSEVTEAIDRVASRGSTIIPAYGGYQQDDKNVIICACSSRQVYDVLDAVKKVDPRSFSIILDSSEVHGEGFKYTRVGHND